MASTAEWVEIVEPRTQEHMFANLTTGECVWDPPQGVPVKKTSDQQWWELFDQNTSRFYYYNAKSQKTVWHRPSANNCDIIPLAKLQTLKQNTEVKEDEEEKEKKQQPLDAAVATQTAEVLLDRLPSNGSLNPGASKKSKTRLTLSTITQTSPLNSPKAPRRSHRHHHHRHHRHASDLGDINLHSPTSTEEFRLRRKQGSSATYASPQKNTSQRFLHTEGGPRSSEDRRRTTIGPAQAKYYSIPHRGDPSAKPRQPPQQLYSVPTSSKKSLDSESFRLDNGSRSLNTSGDSPSSNNSISRSVSFMSRQPSRGAEEPHYSSGWRSSLDNNSGGRRSVESTPQSSRRLKGSPESNHSGNSRGSEVSSPIEGYCTPMINRKQRSQPNPLKQDRNGSARRSMRKESNSSQSPIKDQMSISELVDSGLSTLTDGVSEQNNLIRGANGSSSSNSQVNQKISKAAAPQYSRPHKLRRNNGTLDRPGSKMSPLQQYILEQAKLSGYRFGDPVDGDRDSYVESEEDWADRHDDSDDFADDEDGGGSDELSKASSVDGDDDRYLSEPTYNNLDPVWLQSLHGYHDPATLGKPVQQQHHSQQPSPGVQSQQDVDAFSEEFDIRMRFSNNRGGQSSSSTMPRPASHQPTSSTTSSSAHQQQYQQNPAFPVPYEVLHPSLQRNTHSLIDPSTSSSTLRSHHHHSSRPLGIHPNKADQTGSMLSVSASLHSAISCESDIEKYALDNLNVQKKGLFRKKMTVKDILTHTKESIRKPLTCMRDKACKKEAIELFRLVQIYMGDRRAKQGMTINSVALEITAKGHSMLPLRDELFVQLSKQTTENLNSRESLRRGWELMAICLSFFPPSPTFAPALQSYIQKHRDPALDYPDVGKWPIHVQISHYAGICAKRLDRIGEGGRLSPKKPSVEDIDQSRLQIFRPSMFGGTLQEVMELQHDRFPHRRLPWILTTLADQVFQLNGAQTEGIFRVPADLDEVNSTKGRFDQWEVPSCSDCHTAASLLKLWFRELYEPLIPDQLYDLAVSIGEDESSSARVTEVVLALPEVHRDVLMFLVRFLQQFSRQEVAQATKMDASNLGTVFAPNCLRCPSKDPSVILENTRKEMAFVKALIFHLDTSVMEGVL